MQDPLEIYYTGMLRKVAGLGVPFSMQKPTSIHVRQKRATNDISHAFSGLNELLEALGMSMVEYIPYIERLLQPKVTDELRIRILVECREIFSAKRGEAYRILESRLKELGGHVPESRRLNSKDADEDDEEEDIEDDEYEDEDPGLH